MLGLALITCCDLHLAFNTVIDVVSYEHAPIATGETLADGASRFLDTTVRPEIRTVQGADFQAVDALYKKNNTAVLL